jgi:hypothetical protein
MHLLRLFLTLTSVPDLGCAGVQGTLCLVLLGSEIVFLFHFLRFELSRSEEGSHPQGRSAAEEAHRALTRFRV